MPSIKPTAPEVSTLRNLLTRRGGRTSWRALEQVAESAEFRSFIDNRHPSLAPMLAGTGRRRVLQIMAASFALGGLSACGRPSSSGRSKIVPYVKQPKGMTPTVPTYYASGHTLDGIANGVVVTAMDGRPIKIEGNPEHPWSQGGTDMYAQAEVLGLYDPDRAQSVTHVRDVSSWDEFHSAMYGRFAAYRDAHGRGVRLLTAPTSSPTLIAQIQRMQKALPEMHWHTHAPVGRDAVYAGAQKAFGKPLETLWDFDAAELIVSFDGDFLDPGPQQIGMSRRWIDARRKSADRGTLLTMHAVAPAPTLTYAKADHHLPVAQRELLPLSHALLAELRGDGQGQDGPHRDWLRTVADALRSSRGRSIVLTGTHQSAALHQVVHQINAVLGNTGKTVLHTQPVLAQAEPFDDLVDAMRQGQVSALIMLDTNPVYTAPADVAFDKLLEKVDLTVQASLHDDETALRSDWHLPLSHPLESWGDARTLDGTVTFVQPTIQRLYDTRSVGEILSTLMHASPSTDFDLLRSHWRKQHTGGDFESAWRDMLLQGFVKGSAFPAQQVQVANVTPDPASSPAGGGIEVLVRPDPTVWDGRFANNAWLQETPKPLTKVVWQNVVALPIRLAAQHKLDNGNLVTVQVGKQSVTGPVWIQPGQHEGVVVVYLGYGRRQSGSVGDGLGYDAYQLRRRDALWALGDGKIDGGAGGVSLATGQQLDEQGDHTYVRVQKIGDKPVGDDKAFTQPTLYQRAPTDGRSWGMVIDLDACTGCNACVVACQAENNVPVVGKEQFLEGRDMHWLRIDRYYVGAKDNPDTRFQPIPCMNCEMAPCEVGCPVEATLHDEEGLNLMIYNRCIGTRACSAYCPYKVRHFNYLHYSEAPDSIQAQRNPEVTVRARGVMEKCTYCVQRIEAARIRADKEDRPIPDGEVITACAGACPTQAIVFGDLNDKASQVANARANPRNYALLGELNTRPHTTYLAALSPNEETS